MSALSPKALAVLQKGRAGLRAAPGERERIEALLDARIATGAPTLAAAAARPLLSNAWRMAFVGALGVAAAGGSLFFALRPASPVPAVSASAPPLAQSSAPATPAALKLVDEPAAEQGPPTSPVKAPEVPSAVPRVPGSLAQEVALLSRATSALRAGKAGEALRVLDEHQRKFPNGALSVERRAARGQALCSLMRIGEGRAELARLAPRSPAAGRTKQVCDAAAATSKKP